jgi:hypothetical protein
MCVIDRETERHKDRVTETAIIHARVRGRTQTQERERLEFNPDDDAYGASGR